MPLSKTEKWVIIATFLIVVFFVLVGWKAAGVNMPPMQYHKLYCKSCKQCYDIPVPRNWSITLNQIVCPKCGKDHVMKAVKNGK